MGVPGRPEPEAARSGRYRGAAATSRASGAPLATRVCPLQQPAPAAVCPRPRARGSGQNRILVLAVTPRRTAFLYGCIRGAITRSPKLKEAAVSNIGERGGPRTFSYISDLGLAVFDLAVERSAAAYFKLRKLMLLASGQIRAFLGQPK